MNPTPIDLSHEARASRVSAYHRLFLTVPVAAPSPSPAQVVEGAASEVAGSTETSRPRTSASSGCTPAAPPSGTP